MNPVKAFICGLAAVVLALAVTAPAAQAKRGLTLGFADPLFQADGPNRDRWLGEARDLGARDAKLFVSWDGSVGAEPANPRDPADPSYSFGGLDAAVQSATNRGLEVLLTVSAAPSWAEGPGRPGSVLPGTWKPSPAKLGDFMAALARRYSGGFGGLPRVRSFQIWNEPNITNYLTPQWNGKKPAASQHYRQMLDAASRGIKSVSPGNQAVTAGLAPYGDDPGGDRTRPLRFWRDVFCLKKNLRKAKGCGGAIGVDVFAHNAINTSGPPSQRALNRDDASSGDLAKLNSVFRAAERTGAVTGGRHARWITEYWWDSNPPSKSGVSLTRQARYTAEVLYLSWKAGYTKAFQLRIRDGAGPVTGDGTRIGDGLFFANGNAKPSRLAFSFPFVADRASKKRVRVWGMAPGAGKVAIERKAGKRWKRIGSARAGSSRVFSKKVRVKGGAKLRARAGGNSSYVWRLKG